MRRFHPDIPDAVYCGPPPTFILVDKILIKKVGPEAAIFICYLSEFFKGKWFIKTHAEIMEDLSLKESAVRRYKKIFIKNKILHTQMIGYPAMECYAIDGAQLDIFCSTK